MDWSWQQWFMAVYVVLHVIAAVTLRGRPRIPWNGWAIAFQAMLLIFVLYSAGFWK